MTIWLLSTLTAFLWPRGFSPNEIGNMQVLPLNVLWVAMLYVDTFMSLWIMWPQWFSMLLPFADKAHFNDIAVLILWACNTRSISLLGVQLAFSLLLNPWGLTIHLFYSGPFTSWISVLPHPAIIDRNLWTRQWLEPHLAGRKGDLLITGTWGVSNI